MTFFKYLLLGAWMVFLFIFTCNDQLVGLMLNHQIDFVWNAHPNFRDLLMTKDAQYWSPFWLLIKSGHFMGFFIFDGLTYLTFKNKKASLVSSIVFAVATEILQLYFNRDGRLIDMGIDSFGAISMFLLITISQLKKKWNVHTDRRAL